MRRQDDPRLDQDEPLDADPLGPGMGGGPAGDDAASDPVLRAEAANDPEVAAMVRALREDADPDGGGVRADVTEASEQIGTGTDR